jgi:hypothetical protein
VAAPPSLARRRSRIMFACAPCGVCPIPANSPTYWPAVLDACFCPSFDGAFWFTESCRTPLVLAGHRICEAPPQEAAVVEVFEFLDLCRPAASIALHEHPDGALILLSPFHQQLLPLALGLERHARNLHI